MVVVGNTVSTKLKVHFQVYVFEFINTFSTNFDCDFGVAKILIRCSDIIMNHQCNYAQY